MCLPAPEVEVNPMHCGDPALCFVFDVQVVQVQGISGDFRSPKCTSGSCPSEVPFGALRGPPAPCGAPLATRTVL